jgi:thioredoxin 1
MPCRVAAVIRLRSALEDAVRQYSSSGTAAFSGKGQTLGGTGSSSTPPTSDGVTNLSPQIKIFLGLVGAYVIFWYFS